MSDCVKRYRQRRDARLQARKSECCFHEDYGVPGMKWGEHNAKEEETSGKSVGSGRKTADKYSSGKFTKKQLQDEYKKLIDEKGGMNKITNKDFEEAREKLGATSEEWNNARMYWYAGAGSKKEKSKKSESSDIVEDVPFLGSEGPKSVKAGGKEWTKESLTKLWQDRGYGKKEASKRAENDFNEMVESQKKTRETAKSATESKTKASGRNAKATEALKNGNTIDAAIHVSEMTRDMGKGEAVTFTNRRTGKPMRLEMNGNKVLSFTNTLGVNQHFSQQQAESLLRDAIFYGKSKVKFE